MRGLLTRVVVMLVAASGLILTCSRSAAADPVCQRTDPATGQCLIWVEAPGTPDTPGEADESGPTQTGAGAACYWDPSKQGLNGPPAGPVPCSTQYGFWSNDYNCYIKALRPPPPADDPAWQGHSPGDGAVYSCYQPQTDIVVNIWSQDTPTGANTGPTPGEVAEIAIESMQLSAIDIGFAPEPGPGSVGLVGMPVWMWAASPDARTYGPATATATAGGITVTATGRVEQITWDMGDGTEVVCDTAGTPYKPEYGRKNSPDCGHTYKLSSVRETDDAYTVTATSSWVITWAGAGQTGTIRLDGLNRSTQIRIGEAQVLVN